MVLRSIVRYSICRFCSGNIGLIYVLLLGRHSSHYQGLQVPLLEMVMS